MGTIQRANHGISLKHATKRISLYTLINSCISMPFNTQLQNFSLLPHIILSATLGYFCVNIPARPILRLSALTDICKVVNQLHDIDVNTDVKSLLTATTYKKEYKIKFNEKKNPRCITK